MSQVHTQITLRALQGKPLADPRIRDMVAATAHSLGERNGITVRDVRATDTSVVITLDAPRIAAIGLAAELRRVTETWYTRKYGEPTLWGEVTPAPGSDNTDDDDAEGWKKQ